MRTISGYARSILSTGAAKPIVGRQMYAVPVDRSLMFQVAGQWFPVSVNPDITMTPYGLGVECLTLPTGQWSFRLPEVAESYSPQGQPIEWFVIDSVTKTVWRGAVLNSIPDGADIKTLLTTYGWVVVPALVVSGQDGPARRGRILFQDNLQEALITLVPPMPNAGYVAMASGATDDIGDLNYDAYIKPGQTMSDFTIRLSSPVPPPRQVLISWTVQG